MLEPVLCSLPPVRRSLWGHNGGSVGAEQAWGGTFGNDVPHARLTQGTDSPDGGLVSSPMSGQGGGHSPKASFCQRRVT